MEALKYLLNFKGTLQFQYRNASTIVKWKKAFTEGYLNLKNWRHCNIISILKVHYSFSRGMPPLLLSVKKLLLKDASIGKSGGIQILTQF